MLTFFICCLEICINYGVFEANATSESIWQLTCTCTCLHSNIHTYFKHCVCSATDRARFPFVYYLSNNRYKYTDRHTFPQHDSNVFRYDNMTHQFPICALCTVHVGWLVLAGMLRCISTYIVCININFTIACLTDIRGIVFTIRRSIECVIWGILHWICRKWYTAIDALLKLEID